MPITINREKCLSQFRVKHGDEYLYGEFKYLGNAVKSTITCRKHGNFLQSPANHKQGQGCPHCGAERRSKTSNKLSLDKVISSFEDIHGELYDYSKFKYLGSHKKSTIVCKEHGDFIQSAANHKQGRGCPSCGVNKLADINKMTTEAALSKLIDVHLGKYKYLDFEHGSQDKVISIVCPTHGEFKQMFSIHSRGHGCPKCGNIKSGSHSKLSKEVWVERFKKVHGSNFDYSDMIYNKASESISVKCMKHGEFEVYCKNHALGQGCQKCTSELGSSHKFSVWKKKGLISNNFSGFKLYFLKLSLGDEVFYKIGKTYTDLKYRILKLKPYDVEVLHFIESEDADYISNLEKRIQLEHRESGLKYVPTIKIGGYTECFSELHDCH